MAFARDVTHDQVAEINITPLVDVMLVLLVIFMVAAPLVTRRIPLDLPQAARASAVTPIDIDLHIDAAGGLTWNGAATTRAALPGLLADAAQTDPAHPPLLRVDANADADYGEVTRVV